MLTRDTEFTVIKYALQESRLFHFDLNLDIRYNPLIFPVLPFFVVMKIGSFFIFRIYKMTWRYVGRVVLFSTIAVYGQAEGQVLNEQSPVQPDTFYAQTKRAAEQIVLNARGADGQPLGTVLRLGAVYGSRIKGNYERLTRALAHNRFIPIGRGLNRRTLVYDKDVGRAAALAVSHPAAAGRVFNVTDGEFHTLNEIIESICAALGRKPPRLSLPVGHTRTLIRLIEKGSHAIGLKPPITLAMIEKYTEDIAVDGSLIQKELGFKPQYDLRSGWQETIQEMRKMGEL